MNIPSTIRCSKGHRASFVCGLGSSELSIQCLKCKKLIRGHVFGKQARMFCLISNLIDFMTHLNSYGKGKYKASWLMLVKHDPKKAIKEMNK